MGRQLLLITNRKSHTVFRYRHGWPWVTLNGVIALILSPYFALFHRIW